MLRSAEELNCGEVLDQLEPWLDGDLEEHRAEAIRRHLDGCPSCRAEGDLAREVQRSLAVLPSLDLPASVLDSVRRAADDEVPQIVAAGRFRGAVARPLPLLMTAAAAFLLVVVLMPRHAADPLQPAPEEVERVSAETRLALAYLGSAVRRGEQRVAERLQEGRAVTTTLEGVSKTLNWARGADDAPSQESKKEGSLECARLLE